MNEFVAAVNLSVTCDDGSKCDNVTLKIIDGKRVHECEDGTCICVASINEGVFLVPPNIATLIAALPQMEKK